MYKKFLKIIISNLFIVLITLNQNAISKPLPPGSGTGDVPANILILLDSSLSMDERLTAGNGIDVPGDIVEDSDGNLIIGEGNLGFLKILTADNTVDTTFSPTTANPAGNRNFRGSETDTCALGGTKNSKVKAISNLGLATNVNGVSGDVIYGADNGQKKIVGINTSGECIEVITLDFRPRAMEVRTINSEDHLFASGRINTNSGWRRYFYTKNLTTGDSVICGSR